jgi:hypothetical protein
MKKFVTFFDGWEELVETLLEPVIALRLDKEGSLLTFLLHSMVEVFIRHFFVLSDSNKEIIMVLLIGFASCNLVPVSCTSSECSLIGAFQ